MPVGVIRTGWQGTTGGPGLTQLFIADATGASINATQAGTATAAVRTFWDAIKANIPDEITLTVSPLVDVYDTVSGNLTASVTATSSPASVTGTATVSYAMASGLKANLNTNVIQFGRRVRGGIFIVPAATSCFTSAGVVSSTVRTAINSAGASMITSLATAGCNLVVYSRPRTVPSARNGSISIVSGMETNEKGAVLRGRRD